MLRRKRAELVLALLLAAGCPLAAQQAWAAQQSANRIEASNSALNAAIDLQRRSILAQRASLKTQVAESGFVTVLGTSFDGKSHTVTPAIINCPPLNSEEREGLISSAARRQAIDPQLLRAVMRRESGFRPCAVSVKGALGLMQLMPATLSQFHVNDAFDPAQSVHAGAALLRSLLDKYQGDLRLTLAAYNAGPARIENAAPETYPSETKSYVADILAELGIGSQP